MQRIILGNSTSSATVSFIQREHSRISIGSACNDAKTNSKGAVNPIPFMMSSILDIIYIVRQSDIALLRIISSIS